MTVIPGDDELLELNTDYLERLQYLQRADIPRQFTNCSVFRVSLYILREQLLTYIEKEFNDFISRNSLSNNNIPDLRRRIEEKVRTTDPSGNSLETKANQRKKRIGQLQESQITADWRSFAKCYTGSFVMRYAKQGQLEDADPKDLLEILMYCDLFSHKLFDAASCVLEHRNRYYGHLDVLLIDSETLIPITCATDKLIRLISA